MRLFLGAEWLRKYRTSTQNSRLVQFFKHLTLKKSTGNGLPEMRTWLEAEEAGKKVGFELVLSIDMATASPVCGAWYNRLKMNRCVKAEK